MGTDKGKTKIGRDAKTGKFITVKEAERRKDTAVVETIHKKKRNPGRGLIIPLTKPYLPVEQMSHIDLFRKGWVWSVG